MKHIVVDLEMNRIKRSYKEERTICKMETIEIGAVVLDDKYHEIGSFKTLVKPQYNDVIEKTYERLTGITTEMVQDAPVFIDALRMFLSWCESYQEEVKLYEWSDSDLSQLRAEIALKGVALDEQEEELLSDWSDFQREYNTTLGLENSVSLENAIMYAGIEFEGRQHDALWDARNTAVLLEIVRTPELYENTIKKVAESLKPTSFGSSLGELFKLQGFSVAV